ncbi:hypothetical protein H6G41_33655 [Tolypothrix sp. FACHB-123]|uniref:hypothetical protein n=1 Tax=Tolypothrix sp. FACHB-123 TaxID=2692868 RepID=UPI001685C43F|nr:hypothetical protein [Tolypothrix sp. FACHB-123]MBD2359461.1 hypothetical protein [Tolypothrix sp. FACHB-123]
MVRQSKKVKKYQMPKGHLKGTARRRGKPILYDEVKESFNIKLTPTAKQLIKDAAKLQNFSPSEFIERWARTELIKLKKLEIDEEN